MKPVLWLIATAFAVVVISMSQQVPAECAVWQDGKLIDFMLLDDNGHVVSVKIGDADSPTR